MQWAQARPSLGRLHRSCKGQPFTLGIDIALLDSPAPLPGGAGPLLTQACVEAQPISVKCLPSEPTRGSLLSLNCFPTLRSQGIAGRTTQTGKLDS